MNRLIGITGLIGAGKTTLCKKIKEMKRNYIFINVDEFRYDIYKDNNFKKDLEEVIIPLKEYENLSSEVINRYIYSSDEYMEAFKKVLYKYLFRYINTFDNKVIIIDWALILKDNLQDKFDKIFYLDVPAHIRLKRFNENDLDQEEIKRRDKLQRCNLDHYNVIKITNDTPLSEIINMIESIPCKFTLPEKGGKAIWEITHKCNYACSYCIFYCNGMKVSNELTTDECFHIIDELYNKGFRHLKITGGEPFIRRDIIDILKYASHYMTTDISTNASLITDSIVEELNKINLKMIHVSVDGDKLTHETLRGKNTYDLTIRGLKALKKSKNKVRIGTVISSLNEERIESLIKDMIIFNADEIIFSIMEPPKGNSMEYYKTKSNKELIDTINSLKIKYKDSIVVNANFITTTNHTLSCPAGTKFLYINNYGCVSPCPWVHEKNPDMISKISLRDNSLDDVLKDEKIMEFIRIKESGKCYGEI